MFEIKKRDGLSRIGLFYVNKKKIETPDIAVVINPHKMIVDMKFIKRKAKADIIITNAYILKNSKHREEIEEKKLHDFLDFDGVIYTDSGTFQMYSKGNVKISNEETIDFQIKIGSDLITPLDVFTLPTDTYNVALNKAKETLRRINYLSKKTENYVFPIQGGLHIKLREKIAKESNKYNPKICAIGGIVPLMENYKYLDLAKIIFSVKSNLKASFPVHAFGAGHPMVFPLLVFFGVDLFDSASYALYAEEGRYITETRTYQLKNMEYFPCSCEICLKTTPKEMTKEELAKHNLLVIMKEIRTIKEMIRKGNIQEYVEQKISTHPELIKAYRMIKDKKVKDYLLKNESSTKTSSLFWIREETKDRAIFDLVKRKLKNVKSKFEKFEWECRIKVPLSLSLSYPFAQYQGLKDYEKYKEKLKEIIMEKNKKDLENIVKDILSYQLENANVYQLNLKDVEIKISKTNRIKHLVKKNKIMATLRAEDNIFIISKDFAKELWERNVIKKYVIIDKEAEEFVKNNKNVFCKFVKKTSQNIRPKDIVVILNEKREFINIGISNLTSEEMRDFTRGVAVNVK